MRNIKFRGFHECENGNTVIIVNGEEKRGEWVEGNYIRIIGNDFEEHHITSFKAWEDNNKVDPKTVGQYTGLKDKNGVEIYEGDIVHAISRMDCANMVVVWDNAKFVLVLCERLKTYTPGIGHKDLLWLDKEIIGNIYDNPELLEVTP